MFPDIESAELDFVDFSVFRYDQSRALTGASEGGGVLIAVRSAFTCHMIPSPDTTLEQVWVSISLGTNLT